VLRSREDIRAPDLPKDGLWVGEDPGRMDSLLAAGPVLVHFIDYSQLNCVRTLPYLKGWHERYGPLGLTVVGIQAPRFPFGADPETAVPAIEELGIEYPVLIDGEMKMWKDYGCEGWPSLFLWGRGGALKWFQFGEGEYRSTEDAIREAVAPEDELPERMEPVRETDVEGVEVIAPSSELMPGGEGPWTVTEHGDSFEVEYEAGGVYLTASGSGKLAIGLDGERIGEVTVDGPGLYPIVPEGRHAGHRLLVEIEGEPEIWTIAFSPAIAD
jgi:hypothetical protein